MNTTTRHEVRPETGVYSGADRWAVRLADAIEAALRAYRPENGRHSVLRQVRVPAPPAEPLEWLRAQSQDVRLAWSDRDGRDRWAAVGVAMDVVLPAEAPNETLRRTVLPLLKGAPESVRFFGGMRFGQQRPAGLEWDGFGAGRFILPRFVLDPAGALLCNLVLPDDLELLPALRHQALQLADPTTEASRPLPMPIGRHDVPEREAWRQNIHRALGRFREGSLEKVVLARRSRFDFAEAIDPTVLLQRLQAATPRCYHVFFQVEPGLAFVGATPERLYRREGRRLRSEAVAGTRPRGATPEQDAALKAELLYSEKDRREQDVVRRMILEALDGLCVSSTAEAMPRVMELAKGRHLWTPIEGTLEASADDAALLERLHPTPAVGGVPRAEALSDIRATEGFDRGWYAGPIGWIGPAGAEFAVGIRSGLVSPRALTLYAGAGIVRGSEPDREWAEIEHKISDFLAVLGLDLRDVK